MNKPSLITGAPIGTKRMVIPDHTHLEKALLAVAEHLDLPPSMFDKVEAHYKSISEWIERKDSGVYAYSPKIYTQGSFAIGTVVRPLSEIDEYDIDMICELKRKRDEVTQKRVFEEVGTEVESYVDSQNFKKEAVDWEKCWTIEYSDDGYTFKVDVLPCLPDNPSRVRLIKEARLSAHLADTAIILTDKNHHSYDRITDDWERGNPKGYAEWFKDRMRVRLNEAKTAYASKQMVKMATEDVPDYKVRTPLQRTIQIIKRHRDKHFEGKKYKTSSIILTTLAARAYDNEPNIVDAMESIVGKMADYVGVNGSTYSIPNPVDPGVDGENFAKQWNEEPGYADAFAEWLKALDRDWKTFKSENSKNLPVLFESRFGKSASDKAFAKINPVGSTLLTASNAQPPSLFNVAHRERPENRWSNIRIQESISISAQYSLTGRWIHFESNSEPLPKGCSLQFHAATNIRKPYQVYWQVVNTGDEAENVGQLRGDIFHSKSAGAGGLFNRESTSYTGMHWVQCYIEKDGFCVAQSEPYVVNIQ